MCGIVGMLSLSARFRVEEPRLTAMRDTMVHRGPDGAGTWVAPDGRVGLAHRRLAILDLSENAAQPMSAADGNVWLTFNGEIYNHAEIRAELEIRGHRFRTDHSDTEVLLRSYLEWGEDCLARLRGMFAFGLWDARSRQLWLVRDRIGVKPLYYTRRGDRFVFASEIKALLADPDQPRRIDENAIFHYLSFLVPPAPGTMFEGIHKLPGGCWLRVEADGTVVEKRYWDALGEVRPLTGCSDEEIAAGLLEHLRTAVQLRKTSDVPVGVFLSGGIDSSTNAALFSDGAGGPVRTFSIGYDQDYGSYTNELHYAREVAERIGAEHHEKRLTQQDTLDFLPRMVELQDEPIADPVCVPLYHVSKLARDNGVVVCQVGEGADELFCGYPNWGRALRMQHLADRVPLPDTLRRNAMKVALAGVRAWGKQNSQPYDWLDRAAHGQPIFWGGAESFPAAQKNTLLSRRLAEQFAGRSSWEAIEPIWRRFQAGAWEPSRLAWMSYLDLNYRLPELLLMRVDKMSMGVSLEARVPFLDHRFVEYAMGIPEAVKTRGGNLKHILKLAVRGVIPDRVIDRPKQGFGVPVHEWLMTDLGAHVRDEVGDFVRETDILDAEAVRDYLSGGMHVNSWSLLNLALWWKTHVRR